MAQCIFCRIAAGEIPAQIVWQDDHALAFRDVHPQAPVHVLFVPKRHVESFADLGEAALPFLSSLGRGIREVVEAEGVGRSGYRLLSNNGPDAGQEVPHVHVHLLAGRDLGPMLMRGGQDR